MVAPKKRVVRRTERFIRYSNVPVASGLFVELAPGRSRKVDQANGVRVLSRKPRNLRSGSRPWQYYAQPDPTQWFFHDPRIKRITPSMKARKGSQKAPAKNTPSKRMAKGMRTYIRRRKAEGTWQPRRK